MNNINHITTEELQVLHDIDFEQYLITKYGSLHGAYLEWKRLLTLECITSTANIDTFLSMLATLIDVEDKGNGAR